MSIFESCGRAIGNTAVGFGSSMFRAGSEQLSRHSTTATLLATLATLGVVGSLVMPGSQFEDVRSFASAPDDDNEDSVAGSANTEDEQPIAVLHI
jgi:hypothetical protein